MKVTADTITDEQIREILRYLKDHDDGTTTRREQMRDCIAALGGSIPIVAAPKRYDKAGCRARCAEIWNARHAGKETP